MRVVLDTNVVVSGTFWTGASFQVLKLVDRGRAVMIITLPIIREYDEIIHSEEILDKTTIVQQANIKIVQKLLSTAVLVQPLERISIVKNDPDDDKFIEAAVEGKADYIISQDHHLLDLKDFRGIKIVSPEEFLRLMKDNNL